VLRAGARALAVVLLGLLLAELAMRAYHHFVPVFVFPSAATSRFRGQPFAPNYASRLNSRGFADVEVADLKRPGCFRVLGLGDSMVFGVVPYESNFLALIEADLAGHTPPVEIVNMGVASIGPRGYLELLADEGLALQPDLVLVSFFIGNDFIEGDQPQPWSYLLAFARYLWAEKPRGTLVRGSRPYQDDEPSFEPARHLEIERQRATIFRKGNRDFEAWLTSVVRNLARMKRLCDARGSGFLVLVLPDEMQVSPELQAEVFAGLGADLDPSLPNRRLARALDDAGLAYFDLLEPMRAASRSARLYKPRDTHWNVAGNRVAADLIRDELLRTGRLGGPATPGR
jgi:hypothetical protein